MGTLRRGRWVLSATAGVLVLAAIVLACSPGAVEAVSDFDLVSGGGSWESRIVGRSLKQAPAPGDNAELPTNQTLILAANRTDRRDPTDGFKTYKNGWDIRNSHYWASVGWTGLPGFIIAAAWLILGLILLLLLCSCCCFCPNRLRKRYQGGRASYVLPAIALILLTIAAVAGAAWLYYGQQKFHSETTGTLNYIVSQSDVTQANLRNVSAFLVTVENVQVLNQSVVPATERAELTSLSNSLKSSANTLQEKTEDNAHKIRKALGWVRLALIIVAGVMVLLVLIGLFFALYGFFSVVYVLAFIGWFLVAATWILVGVFLLLHNAMGDTCVAMEEWTTHPAAQTNLDDIIPCVDPVEANQTLQRTITYRDTVVNISNIVITATNSRAAISYNASGPAVPLLGLTGPTNLSSAITVWGSFVCQFNGTMCTSPGRLTPEVYKELTLGVYVASNLTYYGPILTDLENCDFVRETLTVITTTRCPKLIRYTRWIYSGLILVSGGALLGIVLWLLFVRRTGRRSDPSKPPIYGRAAAPTAPSAPPPQARNGVRAPDGVHLA